MNKKYFVFIVLFTTSLITQTAFGQDANKYRGGSYSGYSMETSAPNTSLPVELISFTATSGSVHVVLRWVTESETGNLGFNIHRSLLDSSDYKKINWPMIKGAGNSYTHREYSHEDKNVQNGVTYYYKLEQVDIQGYSTFYGPVSATPQAGLQPITPTEYALFPNFPNPFNPGTAIEYQLPEAVHVILKIYNMSGQEVTTLVDEYKDVGYYTIIWNTGNAASGIYFYVITAGEFQLTRKMMLMR